VLPEGALGWLIDKVTAQERVAPLVRNLIDDVALVPDLETALRIRAVPASELRLPTSFVTLTGEVLTASGVLHGGVSGEATNSVLVRKNQIAELEREAAMVRTQLSELNTQREIRLAAIETGSARLEEAREEKQNAALLVSTLRGQLSLLEREAKDAERKHQSLDGERASSEARHAEAAARFAQLEIEVAACLEQSEGLQARRGEAQSQLEILRAREAEVAGELNELKIKVATERQRHSSLHHQRAPMEARLQELRDLITQRQADITTYQQRAESTAAENAEITANLEGLRGQVGEADLAVARLLDERANIAAAAEELGNTLRILRHQLSECHDQRSRLEVKSTQLEMKATALTEHMQKRYQLDLSTFERDLHGLRVAVREQTKRARTLAADASDAVVAGDAVPGPTDESEAAEAGGSDPGYSDDAFAIEWDRVEAMVRELDGKLDAMGPVNMDAIQEYDELEQRHTFLEQQNTDLINAKTELLDTIAKINQTTKVLFADTFEKIRTNFAEMFTELFGGGKANLILTDESDPLESGIDIIAKPPGKQLQSISLLSGGEKTMTAVAMLFSIYMVKPSPFCVLDEMDAPLDESNISRFIKILDRFVGQSQFVVISHNKRTIARADAIYGVTMEEHGVSKLVGVKFSTRERNGNGGDGDVLSSSTAGHVPSVAETFGKHGNLASEADAESGAA
jgi:chromosome segregation protein